MPTITAPVVSSFATWKIEALGCLFSIACLIALIALLATYDAKPVFNWHSVTLNALVSILSTGNKAAILMAIEEALSQWKWILFWHEPRFLIDFERLDSASRGPWDSTTLLWRLKDSGIGRLGAALIIASLAIDAFAQQLIQNSQHIVYLDDNEVSIVRAQRYSKGNEFFLSAVPLAEGHGALVFANADFPMQSAVYYGLTEDEKTVSQQTLFNCASSNCTFPHFTSLSVCSRCSDVSSTIKVSNVQAVQASELDQSNGGAVFTNGTAMVLPNGLYLDNSNGWTYGSPFSGLISGATLMASLGTGNASQTVGMQDIETMIWSMAMIRVPQPDTAHNLSWPNIPIEAWECSLYYCVQNFTSAVINGTLQEVATEVSAGRQSGSFTPSGNTSSLAFSPEQLNSVEFDNVTSALPKRDLSVGAGFNISQAGVDSISSFFQSQFQTTEQVYHANVSGTAGKCNGYYITVNSLSNIQYKPSIMSELYESTGLNQTFQSIAHSMSNALRAGADNSSSQTGKRGVETTFYRIEWPWITLPVLVSLFGILFLFVTISNTHRARVPVWKSSALAAILVGGRLGGVLSTAQSVHELEAIAKKHRAETSFGRMSPEQELRSLMKHDAPAEAISSGNSLVTRQTSLATSEVADGAGEATSTLERR